MRTTMRYLSCFLGFSLFIITSQTVHTLVAGQLSPSSANSLFAQNYGSEDSSVDNNSSPSRGSDRRDS